MVCLVSVKSLGTGWKKEERKRKKKERKEEKKELEQGK